MVGGMVRLKKRGDIFLEATIVSLLVIMAIAATLQYVQKKFRRDIASSEKAVSDQVRKWRQEAELVVVGRIINTTQELTEQSGQYGPVVTGYGFFNLAIESVERGRYVEPTLKIYVGWYSSLDPPALYPPSVKKDYRKGDRLKVFLFYDKNQFGYYTPGAYYTIESLKK